MEVILVVFIFLFAFSVVVVLVLYGRERQRNRERRATCGEQGEVVIKIRMQDVIKLANISYIEELEDMMKELGVESKLPVFYKQYQQWSKKNKDSFLENLLKILIKDKGNGIEDLYRQYPAMSNPEILLMWMIEKDVDNKNIARILFTRSDTLKKRKTRLKTKMTQQSLQEEGPSK